MKYENVRELIPEEQLKKRVLELGQEISQKFSPGTEITMICILKGSFLFYADLVRAIQLPVRCEFLSVSSYGNEKSTSGEVKLNLDISTPLEGRNVVIVEDIVDSGLTLKFLRELLLARGPKSLYCCSLLMKPDALKVPLDVEHVGFKIGNEFVVGYGLDYAQKYRELPFVGILQT